MFVYESVEGHAVLPAGGEVSDVDIATSVNQRTGGVINWDIKDIAEKLLL